MSRLFATIVSLLLIRVIGSAQTEVQFSVGGSVISESILPAGSYDVWLFTGGTSRQITKRAGKTTVHFVTTAEYGHTTHRTFVGRTYDAALNLGFDFRWKLAERLGLHFKVATGPAYLSTALPEQAGGFLFSNNFILGFRYALNPERIILSPGIQFRHMSNAKLKAPNSGIDNVIVTLGLNWPIVKG